MARFISSTNYSVIEELYFGLTISSGILLLLELIKPGLVIAYISLNYWLLLWCISGILVVYIRRK